MKHLTDPYEIGGMRLKNRFLRSATWEALSDEQGHVSPKQFEIYRSLAEGQVGLICTGYARILKEEQPNAGMMGIYDDCFVEEYRRLTDMVHTYGSRIMMQLAYGGTKTTYRVEQRTIFSPSDVPEKSTGTQGTVMTKEDIHTVAKAYGEAAARVKMSGFDAVEIHGGHTYLLNQFLSPYYNRRTDEYGGSLENRFRIIREIYEAMRETVGDDFPILIKITCSDFMEGGLSFEEAKRVCKMLEDIGIQAIEVSGNIHGKAETLIGSEYDGHRIRKGGYFIEYAEEIAQECGIPILVTGGFCDYGQMEEWLRDTKIEGFGLCRPLLSEPHLIKRWLEGDKSPARCIHCSRCRTKEGNYCTVFGK